MRFLLLFTFLFSLTLWAEDVDLQKAAALVKSGEVVVVDVRTPGEWGDGIIKGAVKNNYYEKDFRDKLGQMDKTKNYLFVCRSGGRSSGALKIAEELEFKGKLYNLDGGMNAWYSSGFPTEK